LKIVQLKTTGVTAIIAVAPFFVLCAGLYKKMASYALNWHISKVPLLYKNSIAWK